MAIIAIARELAALGEEVAHELVRITGYRYIDRDYMENRLGEFGIGPEKRHKYDEKKPGLWASLSQERDDYLHFLKTVLYEESALGDCVFVGRGSTAILRGLPHLVSVRLAAPLAIRVARVKLHFNCDERHALQLIEQSDRDRSGFHKYFFSIDWRDTREYSIALTMAEQPRPREAAEIIDAYRSRVIGPEMEQAGKQRVADLLLGQNVITELVYTKKLPLHFLEADARGSRVVLHGVSNTQSAIEAAVVAARAVPGVSEVESAIQVVQEFTVMP